MWISEKFLQIGQSDKQRTAETTDSCQHYKHGKYWGIWHLFPTWFSCNETDILLLSFHSIVINFWLLQCDCTSRTGCWEKSPVHSDLKELSFTVSIQHAQTQFNISYPSLIIEVERLTKHVYEFDLCCLLPSTMTYNCYPPILPISRVNRSLFATSCLVRLSVE